MNDIRGTQLQTELAQAERLARSGDAAAAARAYERALGIDPDNSRALDFLAMAALARGDLEAATALSQRACNGQPPLALAHANRATILQALGDIDGAITALEACLQTDAAFVPARLEAARLLDSKGQQRRANAHRRSALAHLPPIERLPLPMQEMARVARLAIEQEERELARFLEGTLEKIDFGDAEDDRRFRECFDILLGRKQVHTPKPGFMHFPKVAPLTFFPRSMFPWLAEIEDATHWIMQEFAEALPVLDESFMPYVQKNAAELGDSSTWKPLNYNRDWDVLFLYNQGEAVERNRALFPRTCEILDRLPLVRIPGRGPTAFFSRLRPGTHIPPHHGATNTRLIAHLPLIVPDDCAIRVGNDIHAWQPGELVVFDDTIEHEAWNRSKEDRIVLIFDVWNPFLTEREQQLVTHVTAAMAEFYPERQHLT